MGGSGREAVNAGGTQEAGAWFAVSGDLFRPSAALGLKKGK
ncbi:hypothetical protein [Clostridium sp. MCC353]|nr:hypothetical protein [Clostridium sp. MCC353]